VDVGPAPAVAHEVDGLGGIPSEDGIEGYAGVYRKRNVQAGSTVFPDFHTIEREMGLLVEGFTLDIQSREEDGEMDPFYLAADLCQDFVFIHPFQDGNGRMCRLLANAVLIRYAGVFVMWETEWERKEYMSIVEVGADGETEEVARGMLGRFFLERGAKALEELRKTVMGEDEGRDA